MRTFSSIFMLTILFAFTEPVLRPSIAQDKTPSTIRYKISAVYKRFIMDGKIHEINSKGSEDLIFKNLEYSISDIDIGKPVLRKLINGKEHPKGKRQLIQIKTSHNGNIFFQQEEPDIPYNDGFIVLITIFPKQRIVIHSYQHELDDSSIVTTQLIGYY